MYSEKIQNLRRSIMNKRQKLLTEPVVLLHDNAHSHVFTVTYVKWVKFKWKPLDYPSYSPNLSPCDFREFDHLKKHLKAQSFNLDDELKDSVKD